MATADQLVVLNNKQSLGLIELRERLFEIIDKWDNDVVKALWDEDGWFVGFGFNGPPTLSSPATGKFQISTTVERGTDGLGNLVFLNETESYVGPHDFENAHGIDYYVGLMVARVPTVIKTSLETGLHEYTAETEIIGRSGPPLLVTDNGTTITFRVDTVTEVGRSNAGRKVMVYLNDPVSGVESVAIEECTVQFDGTNYIDTTGLLGQTPGSVSTTPSDYEVVLLGPRVSRDTDLSTLNEGTLFIGTMEGDSGAPVSVFDYSGATTMIPIPDLWNVLRYGPNGDLKIEVKKHGSDSGVAQIAVKHTSGYYTFEVDGSGNTKIRDATTGTLLFHIDSTGKIQECEGLIKSTIDVIEFDDVNTASPIPLSDSDQTALPSEMQDKTIIGIAEGLNTGDLWSKVVLSGCELTTSLTSLDVDFGAGTVLYKGFKYDKTASTSPVAMPPSVTRYAKYQISAQAWVLDSSFAGDLDDDWIYVAKLISSGSGVTEVVDLRAPAYRIDRRFEYLVGDLDDGGAYETDIPHFKNVGDALKAIDVWANDAAQKRAGPYTIRVFGKCEETDTPLQIPIDGVEIVGSRARRGNPPYGPFIGWTDATALFDLNGQDRLVFKDLHMIWGGGATPGGAGAPVRVCFVNTGSAVDEIRIQNCYGYLGDGFFYHSSANANGDVLIENCKSENQGTCGVVFVDTSDLSDRIRILNFDFVQSGNNYTTNNNGIYLRGWADAWVLDGFSDGSTSHGIVVQSSGVNVRGNSVGADGDGILVQAGCTGVVTENRIVTVGGDGIACVAHKVRITENTILDTTTHGINIGAADEVTVADNHLKTIGGRGITTVGPRTVIRGNHIVDPTSQAIYMDAAGCSAEGNELDGAFDIDATASADFCSIIGNLLDGGDINVSGDYPVVNGNRTKGGDIVLDNRSDQKGVVIGNNLRLSAGTVGSITSHGQDDVAHNQV